jgi:hypothetical protein
MDEVCHKKYLKLIKWKCQQISIHWNRSYRIVINSVGVFVVFSLIFATVEVFVNGNPKTMKTLSLRKIFLTKVHFIISNQFVALLDYIGKKRIKNLTNTIHSDLMPYINYLLNERNQRLVSHECLISYYKFCSKRCENDEKISKWISITRFILNHEKNKNRKKKIIKTINLCSSSHSILNST